MENKKAKTKRAFTTNLFIGKEKDYFIENVSMLLTSGMSIISALEAIQTEVKSGQMKRVIGQIKEDVDTGSSFSDALESAKLMPAHIFALVRIGEETGRLSENLKMISLSQQKERIFKSKIRSAMMYPVLVLTLSIIIGIGIAWFILPRLATVFSQMRMELPLITKILIGLGNFFRDWGTIAIPVFVALLILTVFIIFINKKTKHIGQSLLFAFPGIKELIQSIEISRAGFILGTLLKAGVPIVKALESHSRAASNRAYKLLFAHLSSKVEEGATLQQGFAEFKNSNKLIPIPIQQMIISGEQSGNLTEVFSHVGQTYEEKTDTSTKNLTVILEPILLIIVWLGVVAVALAVILPIYSLIGGMNQETSPPPPSAPAKVIEVPVDEPVPIEVIEETFGQLEILDTEIGYLNVRDEASRTGTVIDQVDPGDILEFQSQEGEWYEIILPSDETGWVFEEYVEIIEPLQD